VDSVRCGQKKEERMRSVFKLKTKNKSPRKKRDSVRCGKKKKEVLKFKMKKKKKSPRKKRDCVRYGKKKEERM